MPRSGPDTPLDLCSHSSLEKLSWPLAADKVDCLFWLSFMLSCMLSLLQETVSMDVVAINRSLSTGLILLIVFIMASFVVKNWSVLVEGIMYLNVELYTL